MLERERESERLRRQRKRRWRRASGRLASEAPTAAAPSAGAGARGRTVEREAAADAAAAAAVAAVAYLQLFEPLFCRGSSQQPLSAVEAAAVEFSRRTAASGETLHGRSEISKNEARPTRSQSLKNRAERQSTAPAVFAKARAVPGLGYRSRFRKTVRIHRPRN